MTFVQQITTVCLSSNAIAHDNISQPVEMIEIFSWSYFESIKKRFYALSSFSFDIFGFCVNEAALRQPGFKKVKKSKNGKKTKMNRDRFFCNKGKN